MLFRPRKFQLLNNLRILYISNSKMSQLYDNLADMRKPYNKGHTTFTEDQLVSKEPFGQFADWFDIACKTEAIEEANGMCLATATKDGTPSSRFVLLKGYSKEGFVFYTKYDSRKGKELLENPKASLCFYWECLRRSVRIDGVVKKIPADASSEYFNKRPKSSQVAACISCVMPEVIPNRKMLADKLTAMEEEFKDKDVQRPENWGGYLVVPHRIEFWQGQTTRAHDRILFRKKENDEVVDPELTQVGEDGWLIERLSP